MLFEIFNNKYKILIAKNLLEVSIKNDFQPCSVHREVCSLTREARVRSLVLIILAERSVFELLSCIPINHSIC